MPRAPQIAGRHWIMVTLLGMIWGGSFLFTEIALRGVSPYWLVAYRMGIAAGLSFIIWGGSGWTLFTTQERSYLPLLMITLLNAAVPFTLISWGQQHVSSGFAGVSMAAVGLFVLPLAHVLVPGEKINAKT
ncbi:MAG: DMT family transporter, partial [Paracoccaceae bacterium]